MSTSDELIEEFELCLPSDTSVVVPVQDRIISLLETAQYHDRDVFGMRLALEEALVNAIKHGNAMDPSKRVRVFCRISNDRVRVEIEDEGVGFDPHVVPDPTSDANLERPCGRGIMLMRAFMTLIEYNARGNRITIEKQRTPRST